MNDARPLAQDRLHDYQLYQEWRKTRSATSDPELLLKKVREVSGQLKTKGALAFQLADEEAKLTAQAAERTAQRAQEDKALAAAEAPQWQAALAAARKENASYQFGEALTALEKVRLTSATLQAERERELQRERWLVEWKNNLLGDINHIGFGGAVTDIHGVRYDGPVRRATAQKFELRTRYGSVMTDWLNLSPKMLLTMSRAFIRPGVADDPEREWLCAIFAKETGQPERGARAGAKGRRGKAGICRSASAVLSRHEEIGGARPAPKEACAFACFCSSPVARSPRWRRRNRSRSRKCRSCCGPAIPARTCCAKFSNAG